jgi:glucosamine-6-phosphate deaminase
MDMYELKNMLIGKLKIQIYSTREELGKTAAKDVGDVIYNLLEKKKSLRIIFAAAPSQNELLSELIKIEKIDWSKITAFHMDEYVGLSRDATQTFGKFLSERIFDKVPFKKINYIKTEGHSLDKLCVDYANLLLEKPIDIVCMGIGENGHIAFNDPPYANFFDPNWVKVVELDEISRQQQVNDKCFSRIEEVPKKAITLTIPALLSASYLFIVVPAKTKANAVKNSLYGPITEDCPASILRKHNNAILYLDNDSSVYL